MKKILVIGAHPDDEVLGLGGTIALHKQEKEQVYALIFADGESARDKSKAGIKKRQEQAKKAAIDVGIKEIKFLDFQDQKLDTISVLELTKHIESNIKKIKPNIIYTHFGGDLNQDHRKVFEATMIACRTIPESKIDKVICYETPSSTEWGLTSFKPNLFVNIDKTLSIKLKALQNYKTEIKKFPHPRSIDSIKNRAKFWGSVSGLNNAEAFFVQYEIIR